jgi:hypothetical protein
MVCVPMLLLSLATGDLTLGQRPQEGQITHRRGKFEITPEDKASMELIDTLTRDRDIKGLEAIARKGGRGALAAHCALCELLDPDNAIAYCTRLDIRSEDWRAAVQGLKRQPRKSVVGYMRQACTSSVPEARWTCYTICREKNWDDLLDLAKDDRNNAQGVHLRAIFEATVGETAREYLRHFGR